MNIVFIHAGPPIDGNSLARGPLGGTETALIGVARALAKNTAHNVLVFTNPATPGTVDGVSYRPTQELASWALDNVADVLISIRQWVPVSLPVRARFRVYFSPDAHDQPFLHRAFDAALTLQGASCVVPILAPAQFLPNVDAIFCVGKWQADTFVSELGFPEEKLFITANGVFLENFSPKPIAERGQKLAYSSTPFRGLEHLLRLFPAVRAFCPGAELDVYSGMGVYGVTSEEDEKNYGPLYRAVERVGAVSHGSVKQVELSRALCASRVLAYPNTFAETFCIAALEAQAAGTPVVTSKRAGLAERVEDGVDGFLIDGRPGEPEYDEGFVSAVTKLLTDDALWTRMSEACRVKAASFSYDRLARNWLDFFAVRGIGKIEAMLPRHEMSIPEIWEVDNPRRTGGKIRIDRETVDYLLAQVLTGFGF